MPPSKGMLGAFQWPDRHASFFRTFARLGLLVGLPASIQYSALDRQANMLPLTVKGFLRTACDSIGSPLLCLGYVSWLAIAFRKPVARRLLPWLAPVGRMALSNYLFQSVVSVLLFYGIGGRLFMRISLVASLIIALLIFSIQVFISRAYLRSFQQGPAESVWRRLTYERFDRCGSSLATSFYRSLRNGDSGRLQAPSQQIGHSLGIGSLQHIVVASL